MNGRAQSRTGTALGPKVIWEGIRPCEQRACPLLSLSTAQYFNASSSHWRPLGVLKTVDYGIGRPGPPFHIHTCQGQLLSTANWRGKEITFHRSPKRATLPKRNRWTAQHQDDILFSLEDCIKGSLSLGSFWLPARWAGIFRTGHFYGLQSQMERNHIESLYPWHGDIKHPNGGQCHLARVAGSQPPPPSQINSNLPERGCFRKRTGLGLLEAWTAVWLYVFCFFHPQAVWIVWIPGSHGWN